MIRATLSVLSGGQEGYSGELPVEVMEFVLADRFKWTLKQIRELDIKDFKVFYKLAEFAYRAQFIGLSKVIGK